MSESNGNDLDKNWSVIGHAWAVEHLQAHIVRGGVRHAYLFTGPDGVGRRTLALRFGQALICTQPPAPGKFCGMCRECLQLRRMAHPDLSIVAPEEPSGSIKVDQIRALQHGLYLSPYQSDRRLALLLEFERANANAANALLKTLEEPPASVVLLLTASDAESLLPTVASRCEIVRLQPVALPLLVQSLLEREEVEPASASLVAHLAGGRPGLALQFLREPQRLDRRRAWLDDHSRLLGANRLIRFSYAEDLAKAGDRMQETLQAWVNLWRDVLLRATGARSPLTNPDREGEIESLAAQLGARRAAQAIETLESTLTLLNGNTNPRLALEVLMLDLPRT